MSADVAREARQNTTRHDDNFVINRRESKWNTTEYNGEKILRLGGRIINYDHSSQPCEKRRFVLRWPEVPYRSTGVKWQERRKKKKT